MLRPLLLLVGLLVCPTNQVGYCEKEDISWNCTIDKIVKGVHGQKLTLVSKVSPLERCYFVFTNPVDNYQCCYGDKDENDCDAFKYDPRCLKSDKYFVNIDSLGLSVVNTCNLTIESIDSSLEGEYQSFNNFGQAIQKCNITVKTETEKSNGNVTAGNTVVVFLLLVVTVILLIALCDIRKKWNRRRSERLFHLLAAEDEENFKKELSRKSIFGWSLFSLTDRNDNSIYHIAAHDGWTVRMRDIVLNSGDEEEQLAHKRIDIFAFKPSKKMPHWLSRWAYPEMDLNSKNKDGDTPLMIAAGQGQIDIVEALIDNGADASISSEGHTALEKAMLGYSKDQEDAYLQIFSILKKVSGTTGKRVSLTFAEQTFKAFSSARCRFQRRMGEVYSRLAGSDEDQINLKPEVPDDIEKETMLQKIVRLGDDYKDIVALLLSQKEYPTWKKDDTEVLKTLYNAVAGGHKDVLQLLLENGELQWKDYSGECLLRAVEENNKTAVNFIFGKISPLPTDDKKNEALVKAVKRKEQFKKHWKTNEVITTSQIIATLNHAQDPTPNKMPSFRPRMTSSDYDSEDSVLAPAKCVNSVGQRGPNTMPYRTSLSPNYGTQLSSDPSRESYDSEDSVSVYHPGQQEMMKDMVKAALLREESKIKTINAEVTSIDKSDLSSALPTWGMPNEGDITLEREKVSNRERVGGEQLLTNDTKPNGPPSLVELRSSGGAGECHGSRMGVYQLLPDGGEGGSPVYRQLHDGDNNHFYLYRAGDFWQVWKELGKKTGWLKAKVLSTEDQMMPPVKGWTYYDDSKYVSDPTMVCSRDLSPACGEIVVKLEGKAKKKYPSFAGIYKPVKGKRQRGRWLLQHSDGSERYLRVRTGTTNWEISNTIDGSSGWIQSASAGSSCPAHSENAFSERFGVKSWHYSGNSLHDGDIKLTCSTHS